jgi:hypothetical protein
MTRFLIAAALGLITASPAQAQCRLCGTPVTTRADDAADQRVTVEVETNINFDRLVVLGSNAGDAEIRPDGSRFAEGAVTAVGARAMVGTAILHGEPNRSVRVDLPSRIQLYSLSGGEIAFDQVTSDLPPMPRLDAGGTLSFRFGGRLHVSGDADGDYRGDLPITAEYQ